MRSWRKIAIALGVTGLALAAPVIALMAYAAFLPPVDQARLAERSTVVVDRDGRLLRPFVMADGRWRMPITHREVDPSFLAMLIAYEDKRFYSHSGVDPRSLLRAAGQLISNGRIISGGSTLSMQVARLIEPREERSLASKFRQMARAIRLEHEIGKSGILDLYLSLAPYGGNLEGIRAASLAYFGREPQRLSPAESALLVALPQSPEARRPDRAAQAALEARTRVLARVKAAKALPLADLARADEEPIPHARKAFPHFAPHLAETKRAEQPGSTVISTSLDRLHQASLERLAKERAEMLGPQLSVAILVIEHETGLIRASIGGADYFDAARAGAMDLTHALRSPGSALKPFLYALAFEEGIAHPETLLEDRPQRFGAYVPENFDHGFQGLITARQALQTSLNLPAVDLLNALGPNRFLARLRGAGADLVLPQGATPGLALALGGMGITLNDLTRLYAELARGGGALTGPVAAWHLADILIGAPPPDNGPVGRIAYKTGTSYGYRDAFAVGFDRKHTIGVWVGRADNAAVPGLVGRKSAGPILFEAFARIGLQPGLPPRPRDALVAHTADLPPPLRHLRQDVPKTFAALATQSMQITFPPDGARIDARESAMDGKPYVAVKVQGGTAPFAYLVNGVPLTTGARMRHSGFHPEGPGFTEIAVIDALGRTGSVRVRIETD